MASPAKIVLLLLDVLFRRVVIPGVLLSAAIVRYNLFSLLYLLFFVFSTLLPGPRLKSQKFITMVFLIVLMLTSLVFVVVQALFQISIATLDLDNCEEPENILRQLGLVQYTIPVGDVLRQILPDAVVLILTGVAFVINFKVIKTIGTVTTTSGRVQAGEISPQASSPAAKEGEMEDPSRDMMRPPFPHTTQSYWQVPTIINSVMEFLIFVLLGLAGITVPSLTSLTYYLVFLFLLIVWSLHMRAASIVRVIRIFLFIYLTFHLVVLDLYQFPSAQSNIPINPNTTTKSLLARLFGLTPIISTDCSHPTSLHITDGIHFVNLISPALLVLLLWALSTDLRLWLFTPKILWSKYHAYYLPVLDHTLSPPTWVCVVRGSERRLRTAATNYGSIEVTSEMTEHEGFLSGSRTFVKLNIPKKQSWEYISLKISQFSHSALAVVFSSSYIFAIIAMMLWSVFFPSWPSLVFLLWASAIWLIPKFRPNQALLSTSPFLVVYSVGLLLLQYIYSLNTGERLSRNRDVVRVCDSGRKEGCNSLVLLIKTCCTIVFFCAFREFMRAVWTKYREHRNHRNGDTAGEIQLIPHVYSPELDSPDRIRIRAKAYKGLQQLIATYWVLAVMAAFLLVFMTGDASALKTVYLIFFFIFIISYQVTERWWFFFNYPLWWLLIIYAVVDLILVYTYQFDVVRRQWSKLYNSTNLFEKDVSEEDVFSSIGLKYVDTSVGSYFIPLIPPAIFIAVMAMQLRFFKPPRPTARGVRDETTDTTFSAIRLTTLMPRALRDALKKIEEELVDGEDTQGQKEEEEEANSGHEEDSGSEAEPGREDTIKRKTMKRQPSMKKPVQQSVLQACYKFWSYVLNKTRILLIFLIQVFWRFLELHLHKIVVLTLFAATLSQISVLYWILLILVVIIVPLSYLNPLTFPLVTLYLGVVTVVKMIYQFPVIHEDDFDFPGINSSRNNCSIVKVSSGQIFQDHFSPLTRDSNWLGLHKAGDDFASYISLPIISTLLLSLWFSARRYQRHRYHSKDITVANFEKGSLFLQVPRADAEKSIWSAFKYFVNHFFELYGLEICWGMLAIAVAVRIDIYGIFYAVSLGVLLVIPRQLLFPAWVTYLIIHGLLLLLQYIFLLGRPPGFCLTTEKVYPWSSIDVSTIKYLTAFKKWVFIPADSEQILNKSFLYADFLVYLLVCLQVAYFRGNPSKHPTSDHYSLHVPNFFNYKHFIDYIKHFVFQYFFWVSLFLVFFTAVTRVSLIGILYLLIVFYFVYRGQAMLKDSKSKRRGSWSALRWISWLALFLRVSFQIMDCVLRINDCVFILLVNGACSNGYYYGATDSSCDASNVGLWVDALNFAVISIQIIIFDTTYSDMVKKDLTQREDNAAMFRDVFDRKVEEKQDAVKEKREKELIELEERANELGFAGNTVDHLLHGGVRIPDDVVLTYSRGRIGSTFEGDTYFKQISTPEMKRSSKSETEGEDGKDSEDSEEEEQGTIVKTWQWFVKVLMLALDDFTLWLEESSALYQEVVEAVQTSSVRSQSPEEVEEETPLQAKPHDSRSDEDRETRPGDTEGVENVVTEGGGATRTTGEGAGPGEALPFDRREDILEVHLQLAPSEEDKQAAEEYEAKLKDEVGVYTSKMKRLLLALYYVFLSHSEYVVYFLLILNIILNGSILSLIYAVLLFGWGLLTVPWPSRRFWMALIFYSMFVLVFKYAFQFRDIEYWDGFNPDDGLYPPRIIGIEKRNNFFANAAWDMLLLMSLLIHRGLLRQYGLWGTHLGMKLTKLSSKVFQELKYFFVRLLNPDISLGSRDYYVLMLTFDVLCFLTIIFGVNSFGVGVQESVAAAAEYIQTNNIPIIFLVMLLLQFISMLVDRAIYLQHSLKAKLVFQVFLLVVWHLYLFFVLPSKALTNRSFTSNVAAQCIYFFKAVYFIISAMQIIAGYPTRVLSNFLATKYTTVSWLAFSVYRLIPILPELREVMDWVFTDTSLSLINWLKVQEIYAQLYLVKVKRNREKDSSRDLGEKQSLLIKVLLGTLLVSALVLLIWGPLLLISFISGANQSNPPTEVHVQLRLAGFEPLVGLTAQNTSIDSLTPDQYNNLVRYVSDQSPSVNIEPTFRQQLLRADFRRVRLVGNSTSLWVISPPARSRLIEQLTRLKTTNSSDTITLEFSWTISRIPPTGLVSDTTSGNKLRNLRYQTDNATIDMLLESLSVESKNRTVQLRELFPVIIEAPANGRSRDFTTITRNIMPEELRSVSCDLEISENDLDNDSLSWWSLRQSSPHILSRTDKDFIDMIIYSTRVAPPVFSAIAGLGIIGLYVSVVLVIGRFIRGYIANLPHVLIIDEILHPEPLLELCKDIFLVRESKRFRLEEILVGKLFYIFRSPEKIVQLTEEPKIKTD